MTDARSDAAIVAEVPRQRVQASIKALASCLEETSAWASRKSGK
jgi:hypothetical protein